MLDVGRIKTFATVAGEGSISAAALRLSYTQSAVSQQISRLEREARVPLLERHARGVRLTPAGQALLEHSEAILAHLEATEATLAAIAGVRGGLLRIASFSTAGATLLPLAIATFRARHPDVELTLVEDEPELILPRLLAGELDLALLFEFEGAEEPEADGVRRLPLLSDPMYLALPRGHRLADRRRVRLEDLRGEAWIQTSAASACAKHVVQRCLAAGFEPQVSFESDDYQTVQGLVAAGVGVALMPELALSTVRQDIAIRELHPSPPLRHVTVATPSGPRRPPAASAMIEILSEIAERYTPLPPPG